MNFSKIKSVIKDQTGVASGLPVLLAVVFMGVLFFLVIAATAPIQGTIFGQLFQRSASHAESDSVNQQYYIEFQPYQTVLLEKSDTGYVEQALLKNLQGNVVTDQSDFSYHWSSDDNQSVTLTPSQACTYGIISPCPNDHIVITPLPIPAKNSITLHLAIYSTSSGAKIAEGQIPVNLLAQPAYSFQIKSPNGMEKYTPGQSVQITWVNGKTQIDSYDVSYQYYQNGVFKTGFIGRSLWGGTSMNWVIPQELNNQQVRLLMTAKKNGESVGQDISNEYFFVSQ
jgi:hypothetical protein